MNNPDIKFILAYILLNYFGGYFFQKVVVLKG